MPQNVQGLLKRWWEEQHRTARQSGSVVGVMAMDGAESRMMVISSLLSLVDPSVTVDDQQEKTLWASICSIAAIKKPVRKQGVWVSELREEPLKALAATLSAPKS